MRDFNIIIQANSNPSNFVSLGEPIEIIAAANSDDGDGGLPTFTMNAYNGGPMNVGFDLPVIVDLAGVKKANGSRPAFLNHDPNKVVGHLPKISVTRGINGGINAEGIVSGTGEAAIEVVGNAKNKFPYRASIGASVQKLVRVEEGEKAKVNGQTVTGPLFIARQSILNEISFVPLAADDTTVTKMVAGANNQTSVEVYTMNFESWLKTKGHILAELEEDQVTTLKAEFEAEVEAEVEAAKKQDPPVTPTPDPVPVTAGLPTADQAVAELRAAHAAEANRIAEINAVAGSNPEICAKAIAEGWSSEKAELEVLRAGRPGVPHIQNREVNRDALRAGFLMSIGVQEQNLQAGVRGQFAPLSEQAINAGYEFRAMSLGRFMEQCVVLSGGRVSMDTEQNIRAGFGTVDAPTLLTEGATRTLVDSFLAVKVIWDRIARVVPVSDLKTHTRIRLTDAGYMEKVGSGGELKTGDLGEDTYTQKADTYGRMFTLTREMVINDDIGAFLQIPRMIGRQGSLAIEKALFDLILANTGSFFGSGNSNYISGSDTVLSIDSLTALEALFLEQVDSDSRPIIVLPEILLVPPALKALAERLMKSEKVVVTGSTDAEEGDANPHAGKWTVESSPYLADSISTSGSDTAFYLFGNPNDIAAFEVAFLRGVRIPTIERVDMPANVLGIGWRGYHDFGVNQANHEGAAMSKGAS